MIYKRPKKNMRESTLKFYSYRFKIDMSQKH